MPWSLWKRGRRSRTKAKSRPVRPAASIRLVAVDLDDTLLQPDKQVTANTIAAVRACEQRGIPVVLASARPPRSVFDIYQKLGLRTVQINYNGALIYEPHRGEVVHHHPLAPDLAGKVIELARHMDAACKIGLERLDRWFTDDFDPRMPFDGGRGPDGVGPLHTFLTQPVTKLIVLGDGDRLARVREAIERTFGKKVEVTVADPRVIQVMAAGVDKAVAVAMVAGEFYDVPRQQVMTIGDAPNDVGMLKWAGWGVAVMNAFPEALQAADAVVPASDAEGVVQALRRYILDAPAKAE